MKKSLIALSLGGALVFTQGAIGSETKISEQWFEKKAEDVEGLIEYIKKNSQGNSFIHDDLTNRTKYLTQYAKTLKELTEGVGVNIDSIVNQFIGNASKEKSETKIGEMRTWFSYGITVGKLLAALYEYSDQNVSVVYSQIALKNDGYYKQYLLAPRNKNNTPFYEKPTTRPWGGWLGLGYVDQRSRGQYWSDKAKYTAATLAAGAAIYGGYKGVQYLGSERYEKSQFGQTGFGKSVGDYARGALSRGSGVWNIGVGYAKGAYGSVSNYFTKPEQRRLEHIDEQKKDIKDEILQSGENLSRIEQQKKAISQDSVLPVEQKEKQIKEFEKEANRLSAQIKTKEKEIETLAQKEENIVKKAETRVAKTTRVPETTRIGRAATKAKQSSSPVVIADEKEYLGNMQKRDRANDKRIKRGHSAALEDVGGYSGGMSFAPAISQARTNLQEWNANRVQRQKEQAAQSQLEGYSRKNLRPLTLPEYEQKIRQQAIERKYTPLYKRIFNR